MNIGDLKNKIKEFTPGTTRIEAFSDGVFAIVVTLLVLELRVPHLPEHFSSTEALSELYNLAPKFMSFLVSFFVVAIFWVNHHQLFHSLQSTDRKLLWLNNLLLFWLSFIPFPTAFVGEYPNQVIPVMLYGFALFCAGVSFNLIVAHAAKAGLFDPSISKSVLQKGIKRGRLGPLVYLVSIIAAPFSVYISLAIFILVPIVYFIPQKIVKENEDIIT